MPKKTKLECTLLELRRDGAAIIARAEVAGERIVITSWGKPRAALVSLADLALIEGAKKPALFIRKKAIRRPPKKTR